MNCYACCRSEWWGISLIGPSSQQVKLDNCVAFAVARIRLGNYR